MCLNKQGQWGHFTGKAGTVKTATAAHDRDGLLIKEEFLTVVVLSVLDFFHAKVSACAHVEPSNCVS